MARKPALKAPPSFVGSSEPITTQRAYTLRLRRVDPQDTSWRDALWATHEAINKGAKAFGDWLLTLRGGLSHELAEPPPAKGTRRTDEEMAAIRKNRRILLALSWLSVEDDRGAPRALARVATGTDADSARKEKVIAALREVLTTRRVGQREIESWVADCDGSIASKIRDDAAWINRSAAFDSARQSIGTSLTREEVWDILEPFFASRESYLAPVETDDYEAETVKEKAKDLVQKAGQWLSSRFGTGTGADFASMVKVYGAMQRWAGRTRSHRTGTAALADLAEALRGFKPESSDADGILGLISGPGYKSATRNVVKAWSVRTTSIGKAEIDRIAKSAAQDAQKAAANVGGKGRRPWSDVVLRSVESAVGFTYLQAEGPARHSEFAVMLDHAARRVSIGHSWIKRAEAERRRFEEDARRLAEVPADAAKWLDRFIAERSATSGAAAAGAGYRIRRRAIEGWDEVVRRWKRASCKTEQDRIAAARETQADPDIEKFGDIQLFEALAADEAECVWRQDGKATTDPLRNYVLGHDAKDKQRRFKVPAYRHPDSLRHPVFGDFGNSRWEIKYAVHEAAKVAGAKRAPSPDRAAWIKDRHGLRMGLWDGSSVRDVVLRWSSKRLTKDLALGAGGTDKPAHDVTRADRLGRAAAGLAAGEVPSAAGLFALDDWNGRLQAPRVQLDALAERVAKHGWDATAKEMRNRIKWLVSFSAKLECRGPYVEYAGQFDDGAPAKPFVSRKGELAVKYESNEDRHGHAKLILSRLPGLRVLSVDLGHRFAASCAVWEALSTAALKKGIAGRAIVGGGMGKADIFLHTSHADPRTGKVRTTTYRRIGADKLSNGTDHPAPWARLDRQFLIKLQGEDRPARKCSSSELRDVQALERELGRRRDEVNPLPADVDELMAETVRTLRLSLRRFGDAARIAYAFKPDSVRQTPGGGSEPHTPETRAAAILDALMRWNDIGHGDRWTDTWAADAWNRQIKCELPAIPEDADRWERKRHRADLEKRLAPIAADLLKCDTRHLYELWADRWKTQDAAWRPRLKQTRRWILPRGLRAGLGETPAQTAARRARLGAARNVGGLSLIRITTIRELYQVLKAYAMRPEPDDPRRNIAAKGDDRFDEFGRSVLDVMERLREQRVKQIASRIVEAALGVGRHMPATAKSRNRKRPWVQTDPPCHAVVIENLRNYRPDELQTRRENRALMTWSSGKVRKYLEEACQLHGVHLREVSPNYTSRQCSRTGMPGMRCADVPINDFLSSWYWNKVVKSATKRLDEKHGSDALDEMIRDLHEKWSRASEADRAKQRTLCIPRAGADLFITAPPPSTGTDRRAIQADLNAAANIGLRALLDPDFPGKWWYIPCDSASGMPARDKCAGAACLDMTQPLLNAKEVGGSASNSMKPRKGGGEKTNAWRDVSTRDPARGDQWFIHSIYWNGVKRRIVNILRAANGLFPSPADPLADAQTPW